MKRFAIIISTIISFPLNSFANNSIAKASGISDGMLLFLMLAFICLLLAIISAIAKSIEGISKSPGFTKSKSKDSSSSIKAIAVLVFMGASFAANAAETNQAANSFVMSNSLFWLLLSFIGFLAVIIAILFRSLNTLLKLERGDSFQEEEEGEDLFTKLKLTDRVPVEEESNIMMDHEYDGIRELDNNLPPWWKYMFYATIIFAFVYLIRFHITGDGKLQLEEYADEIEAANEEKAELMANSTESVTEDNVVYLIDAASLEKGAAIYTGNCATCHGQLGEGGAGPNLTDEYWLHGGSVSSVFKTIKYGVPAKGMIAWQSQFSPSQMQQVTSYILSLKGTNPPNGKAPQGEIYVEKEITIQTDSIEIGSTAAEAGTEE